MTARCCVPEPVLMVFVARRLALALALLPLIVGQSAFAQMYQGRELVQATLVSDANAIVPGKPFNVGVLLRMAPHWHTYWKFSGDAGLPTEIKWKVPAGWQIGPIQWPVPFKTTDPGDIQTYGYEDEVLLIQQITPPAKIDSRVKLSAEANWLVCERICIPGGATLQLELPVSTSNQPANTELFARYRRLLPQRWPDTKTATAKWNRTGPDLELRITSATLAGYPAVDFFPSPPRDLVVGHPSVESRNGDEIVFRIPVESPPKDLSTMDGLVVFAREGNGSDRAAWQLGAPVAAVPSTAAPAKGLATFLLFGFLGGLILNLMPCVLPVISLKIFGFIKHAGQDRRQILRSGLAFIIGIFAWFIGLALLLIALKAAGRQITWAAQFTNPYFVLLLAAIVLVFALNLFGVFEITLPQPLMHGMLGSASREGDAGAFFQGVFATALATPCTAPFLGSALGFAFSQSPIVILSIFFAIAAGMSAPYVLLSAQPAWLRFVPKPGPWMLHVKQVMGFLLLGTLLFLLYVLGAQRGVDGVIWASCFLLVISVVCWMKGAFVVPTAATRTRTLALVLMLVLVLASGFYFVGDKFQAAQAAIAPSSIQARVDAELAQGHPVFVDFTAAWCLTCKFNEKNVLNSAEVREAFAQRGVTKIVADWTAGDPEITRLLQQFGRPGVPLYVLYPGKSAEPIVFPELLTKSIVLEKLQTISPTVASK
jgi:thiol:disulfide interchange protein/DsbC/DsbD-like thiol-disulfide interchange protein